MTRDQRPYLYSLNGIFLLDKPIGISSNGALQRVKRLFQAIQRSASASAHEKARKATIKAGHTGSLDPLATGLLPICFGDATKFCQYLLDSDKSYEVTMKLGVRTNTSDAEGEVISMRAVPTFSIEEMDVAFNNFRGDIQQIPSMFSALKHNGKPLYEYARQGITIERPSRPITIYDITVLSVEADLVSFTVKCSKGTYVRTIVDDIGEQLNCGAHVTALRRLSVGPYHASQMMTIEKLESLIAEENFSAKNILLPVDSAVHHWPAVSLSSEHVFALKQGKSVTLPEESTSGWMRFIDHNGEFFGVGEVLPDGKVAPRRLVAY
ncbi:MAG: hypothetical protein ACD_42C00503G0003 [uncultured bacterium]|nr:MAG: hypothetical protein ACD_42C00503G0003 [uncultured bacterium]